MSRFKDTRSKESHTEGAGSLAFSLAEKLLGSDLKLTGSEKG